MKLTYFMILELTEPNLSSKTLVLELFLEVLSNDQIAGFQRVY